MTAQVARPPCPYCGERQSYDEARPSKPRVMSGGWRMPRVTVWDTECRSCGRRLVWAMPLGTFQLMRGKPGNWVRPVSRQHDEPY